MTIEAEFSSYRKGKETFTGKISIPSGSTKVITKLKPTNILVILNINNTRGEIRIKKNSRVKAFKYFDEDDEIGVRVDPSKPIEVKSGQEVQITRKGRRLKEARFWLERDDSFDIVPNPDNRINSLV